MKSITLKAKSLTLLLRMRWVGYVAPNERGKKCIQNSARGSVVGRYYLKYVAVDGRILLK
jgi:hypothetical protein